MSNAFDPGDAASLEAEDEDAADALHAANGDASTDHEPPDTVTDSGVEGGVDEPNEALDGPEDDEKPTT